MSEGDDKKALRLTFQDVKDSQSKLLNWIENLIEHNRPVKEEKIDSYLRLVGNSFLGEGNKLDIGSRHLGYLKNFDWRADGQGSTIDIVNYADLIRYAAYEDGEEVAGEPISRLWKKVRACCLRVAPYALQVAIQSSQELIPRTKRKPDKV